MAGKVEAEGFVVVEDGRVDGAVHEGENGVWGRRDDDGLDVGHEEVVVGLEDGAGGHGGVVDGYGFFGVVDGLDFVVARGGEEEEVGGGAVEHFPVGRGAAAVINAEGVVDGDVVVAGGAAEGEGEGWK